MNSSVPEKYILGVIKIEDKILFLLDFETISGHISPNSNITPVEENEYIPSDTIDRSTKTVFVGL